MIIRSIRKAGRSWNNKQVSTSHRLDGGFDFSIHWASWSQIRLLKRCWTSRLSKPKKKINVQQRPFDNLIFNLTNTLEEPLNGKSVAFAPGEPNCIIYPINSDLWEDTNASSDMNVVQIHKEPKYRGTQMDLYGQIKVANQDASRHNWKEEVKIADKHEQYHQRFIQMLERSEIMRDGHYREIHVAKHSTELEHNKNFQCIRSCILHESKREHSKYKSSSVCFPKKESNQCRPKAWSR